MRLAMSVQSSPLLFCAGAWSTRHYGRPHFISADLQTTHRIESVTTQGRPADPAHPSSEWVQSYLVRYSRTDFSDVWSSLPDVYVGNSNSNEKKTNKLPDNFETRWIGLRPVSWHGHLSLRWEVTGCPAYGKIPLYKFLTLMAARNISVREDKGHCFVSFYSSAQYKIWMMFH